MSEDLVIDRAFDATPHRIWRALTAPDALEQWFWPFPMTADVDAQPGGAYRLDASAMGMAMEGVVTDVQPPGTLGLTWQWRGEPEHTRATITYRAGTTVSIASPAGWSGTDDRPWGGSPIPGPASLT